MDAVSRNPKQLGSALRRYRKQLGLSQMDMSSRVGKRQATISTLESAGNATLDTVFAVLSALDLELSVRRRSKGNRAKLEDIF
jgi:HTH-type transcriptional regulator/antitoxin HipB